MAFVYVTQLMEFGDGLGDLINLRPLRAFHVAAVYGLVNAQGLAQVALNVLITVPIGILLPLVFPGAFGRVHRVFLAGSALVLVTELVQLGTGRHADVDDVIANSAGAAFGAALVTVLRPLAVRLSRRPGGPPTGRWRVVAAVAVIAGVLAPFVTVVAIDGGNRQGVVYYGHLRPSAMRFPATIAATGAGARLYRAAPAETPESVLARLRARLAVGGECVRRDGTWICADGGPTKLFVYPHGTWYADFGYDAAPGDEPATPPDEVAGDRAARRHLAAFGIDPAVLARPSVNDHWQDAYLHLDYENAAQGGDAFQWGKISVTLDGHGKLIGIEDRRIRVRSVRTAETISPRAAIDIAKDVGVDTVDGTVHVRSATAGHHFDEDSGYLVPVWRLEGSLTRESGEVTDWSAPVDARTG
ncbi:VanZ family protein [Nonomuraea sp. NN258]|uniref:VanZ family protein n=1 Tax=Nonomuraea antri TaxID=2730852 RepID=UPI001569D529|nr:VanZ family protein [Nonomuraea antri]NRQ33675.1 VanZ family protein [Nonomuraea antri]